MTQALCCERVPARGWDCGSGSACTPVRGTLAAPFSPGSHQGHGLFPRKVFADDPSLGEQGVQAFGVEEAKGGPRPRSPGRGAGGLQGASRTQ